MGACHVIFFIQPASVYITSSYLVRNVTNARLVSEVRIRGFQGFGKRNLLWIIDARFNTRIYAYIIWRIT